MVCKYICYLGESPCLLGVVCVWKGAAKLVFSDRDAAQDRNTGMLPLHINMSNSLEAFKMYNMKRQDETVTSAWLSCSTLDCRQLQYEAQLLSPPFNNKRFLVSGNKLKTGF